MRRLALLLAIAALATGCGDDDGDDGGSTTAPSASPTQPQSTTEPPAAEEPAADAPSRDELEQCLAEADLEITPGDEPATNTKGEKRTRQPLSDAKAEYAGYVQWPSKRIADVYVAKDAGAAERVEDEAVGFVSAFGLDPAKYVRRYGTVVLTFDDPPPTDAEVKAVEDCAG